VHERQHWWARPSAVRLAWVGLAFAVAALVARYAFAATASLTYDEATYVELARHPWHSSYYPDRVFVRHPPLAFLVLGAWTAVAGEADWAVRLPGLLLCLAAVVLVWDTVRRRSGPAAAGLAGILLGLSFPWLVYGIQATMYPLAAFFAALATHAAARGRDRLALGAGTALALTHLFGFVFLALWVWKAPDRRRALLRTWPAWAWVAAASVAVLAARNQAGPGLGPAWQLARTFELAYQLTQERDAGLLHLFAFLLSLLMLHPLLLERAWFGQDRRTPWGLGFLALTAFLLTGPAFLRYTAVLVPFAFFLGFPPAPRMEHAGRRAAIAVLVALAASTAATAYVNSGLDAGAQNDVPGLVDWRGAADLAAGSGATRVVAAAPPPMAFYLERGHGFHVASQRSGPDVLPMDGPGGRHLEVRAAHDAEGFRAADDGHALLVVPDTQTGTLAGLFRAGYVVCGSVQGAYLLAGSPDRC
jgi:4-amino-4-deoxy-L-arabinose transferase-like glycosyltransferase